MDHFPAFPCQSARPKHAEVLPEHVQERSPELPEPSETRQEPVIQPDPILEAGHEISAPWSGP